ncbi:hypothetical protein FB565_005011 [Actinoplanes lutulentus]|uniref:Uncharacterized protein n=1 Tax=Actinoplanes lutulentus TaxID=1287878 RepID=A0A327ZHE4_9ACTN|nr:hypothetical protein [Actinoplanes lutulentus]RAK40586.1 hypothetical protein B0I29_103624 [Actinoplanes lutulentus]
MPLRFEKPNSEWKDPVTHCDWVVDGVRLPAITELPVGGRF